jgi:hypothetical protein
LRRLWPVVDGTDKAESLFALLREGARLFWVDADFAAAPTHEPPFAPLAMAAPHCWAVRGEGALVVGRDAEGERRVPLASALGAASAVFEAKAITGAVVIERGWGRATVRRKAGRRAAEKGPLRRKLL